MYRALWGKVLFFVGICALVVAGANSEINPTAVEAAAHGISRVRCDGPGVVFFPLFRILVVDGAVFRFPPTDVKGHFPGQLELRDSSSGKSFLLRVNEGGQESKLPVQWKTPKTFSAGSGLYRYQFDALSSPHFQSRLLDCLVDGEGFKEVM